MHPRRSVCYLRPRRAEGRTPRGPRPCTFGATSPHAVLRRTTTPRARRAPRRSSGLGSLGPAETLGPLPGPQRLDELVQLSLVQDPVEPVGGEPDPVIGDATLREVVRADLLRPLPRPHLGPPDIGLLALLPLLLELEESGPEVPHRLLPVLELGALLLDTDDDAGRLVRQANRRVRRIHRLAPRPGRAEHVGLHVLGTHLDLDLLGLWEDGHRGGRGVDTTARFRLRDPLDPVHAGLVLQPRVRSLAPDLQHDLFEPAKVRRARRQHVGLPSLALRILLTPRKRARVLGLGQRRAVLAGHGHDLLELPVPAAEVAQARGVGGDVGGGELLRDLLVGPFDLVEPLAHDWIHYPRSRSAGSSTKRSPSRGRVVLKSRSSKDRSRVVRYLAASTIIERSARPSPGRSWSISTIS